MMSNIIAAEALAGKDNFCMNYLKAYRAGLFDSYTINTGRGAVPSMLVCFLCRLLSVLSGEAVLPFTR